MKVSDDLVPKFETIHFGNKSQTRNIKGHIDAFQSPNMLAGTKLPPMLGYQQVSPKHLVPDAQIMENIQDNIREGIRIKEAMHTLPQI